MLIDKIKNLTINFIKMDVQNVMEYLTDVGIFSCLNDDDDKRLEKGYVMWHLFGLKENAEYLMRKGLANEEINKSLLGSFKYFLYLKVKNRELGYEKN